MNQVIADAAKVEESRMKLGQEVGANMDERSGVERQQMMREFMKEMQMMQHKMKETMSLDKVHVQHAFDVGGKVVEKVEVDENAQKENGGAAVIGNAKRFKYKLASKFEYGVSPKTKEELEEWLNDEEIDNDGKDLYGWSALHKVIFWQKTEFIAPLLEQMSAECINAVGPEGEAAIHMALGLVLNSQGGKAEILEMLCQCEKVDKGQQTKDGQSAMEIARKANADDVVLKMLQ